MCGILGVVKAKGQYITKEEFEDFKILLKSSESRGRHATGIMYICDGEVLVKKAPAQASDLLPYMRFIPRVRAMIGHTRHSTGGSPQYNENNHPIESPSWALVHNGMVSSALTEKELGCISQCDTELFVRMFERVTKETSGITASDAIKNSLEQLSGSWALCFVNKKTREIFMTRNTNPCCVLTYDGGFYFASVDSYIKDTNRAKALGKGTVISDLPVRKLFRIEDDASFNELCQYTEAPSRYGRNYDWYNQDDYYTGSRRYNANTKFAPVSLADIDDMFTRDTIRIYKETLLTNIDPKHTCTKELECYAINMLITEPELFEISTHYIPHLKGLLKQALAAKKAGAIKPKKNIMKKINTEFAAVITFEADKPAYSHKDNSCIIDNQGIISPNLFSSLPWYERVIISKYGAILDTHMVEREIIVPRRRVEQTPVNTNTHMFTCQTCKVFVQKSDKRVVQTEADTEKGTEVTTVTHYACPYCNTVYEETSTVTKTKPNNSLAVI